jgi:TM2 domain-containing membrane protein YozV
VTNPERFAALKKPRVAFDTCRNDCARVWLGYPATLGSSPGPISHRYPEAHMNVRQDTHSKFMGYLLWIFGFLGSHRFYYGKPVTGTIWFFTFGLFFIGWIIDLFLIPAMDDEADLRFTAGGLDYNIAWILLTFLGVFGVHRMYQGKWISGLLYLCTGGLLFVGVLYDFWTLNDQVSVRNARPL